MLMGRYRHSADGSDRKRAECRLDSCSRRVPRRLFCRRNSKGSVDVYTLTEDGSAGTKGIVLDAVREQSLAVADIPLGECDRHRCSEPSSSFLPNRIFHAGSPWKKKMACGVGGSPCVCLLVERSGRAFPTSTIKRICKDGPVFLASGGGIMSMKVNLAGVQLQKSGHDGVGTFGSGTEQ